jgi:hypothetical protein
VAVRYHAEHDAAATAPSADAALGTA